MEQCFISGRELVFHSVLGLLPLSKRRGNVPRYQQVYPNKQCLETAGSNYERAFSDFVQALIKLERLRGLLCTTAIVQINKTNDPILNLTPENIIQHQR